MRRTSLPSVALALLLLGACGGAASAPVTVPPSAAQSVLSASSSRAYADDASTVQVTATVRSSSGAPLAGRLVEFSVDGTGGRLSARSAQTSLAGQASVTLASGAIGRKVVTAVVDGVPIGPPAEVDFRAGPAIGLRFASSPSGATAGQLLASPVQVEVVDPQGRTVLEDGWEVRLSLQGGAAGPLHGATLVTTVAGASAFVDLWLERASPDQVLVASSGALAPATSDPFPVTPGPAEASTSEVVASGSPEPTVGATVQLLVTIRDAFGNPVPGHLVTLAVAGDPSDQLVQPGTSSDAAGQMAGSLRATIAGERGVTGTLADGRTIGTGAALRFRPGPPAAGPGASTLVASPDVSPDDGSLVTLTAILRDQYGNLVPGAAVAFSASGGVECTPPSAVADAAGVAMSALASLVSGARNVSLTVGGGVVATAEATFVPAPASGSHSGLEVTPTLLLADGISAAQAVVTVRDTAGRPLAGAEVQPSYAGVGLLSPASAATDAGGRASFTLTATSPTSGALGARIRAGADWVAASGSPFVRFASPRQLGGTIAGLAVEGLVLASPGLPDLPVSAGATSFAFARPLPEGAGYAVTVRQHPPGLTCRVSAGWGTAGAADVQDVAIACGTPRWASAVAGGSGTVLAFRDDGSLWGWGFNDKGQLLAAVPSNVPSPRALGTRFTSVAVGRGHVLALDGGGQLWAWGANAAGQLGDGTTADHGEPVLIGAGFARVAAGESHSLALTTGGALWAWGDNTKGQLGDGTTTGRTSPVYVGTGFVRVAAGAQHSLAVDSSGGLWAWGSNASGQLGLGVLTSQRLTPALIAPGFSEISAAGTRSAAIDPGGGLWGWGGGTYSPPILSGQGFTSVAVGTDHISALRADHTLWAWGANTYGALGDGTRTYRSSPVEVAQDVAGVAADSGLTVVVKLDGTLWTVGVNQGGQLGIGAVMAIQPSPIDLTAGMAWAKVTAGTNHTLALTPDGALWAWGMGGAGRRGDGSTASREDPVLVGQGYAATAGGDQHSAAVKTDGTLWTWGFNGYGQIGDAWTVSYRTTPGSIGSGFRSVAAGTNHTVALKADGTVWALGANRSGQVGDGTTVNRNAPVQVLTGIAKVAAGGDSTLALEPGGRLWTWGLLGSPTSAATPTEVGTGYVDSAAGMNHFLAVSADGGLWAWGSNSEGQLGDGSGLAQAEPVKVGSGFVAVAAGTSHSLALQADGSLWAWGANWNGQLGDGTTVQRSTPVLVGTGFVAITAGQNHSLGILAGGALRGWGRAYEGQLGAPWWSDRFVEVR